LEDQIRRTKSAGHVERMCDKRNVRRILAGKPEGKRPLGRPICMWVDDIKRHLREIGWDGMDRIDLAQDRDQWWVLVNMVLNLRVPLNFTKFLSSCATGGLSRMAQIHGRLNFLNL
jgi:hypothetical protein